ncbi:MAG: isoprenylcysteine carboxylmethyltransferase family protein [Deltaproteobacteria bacterium]|nr:isoprenylcysteine carboxylmethyltransferase family protein [Deltaproteobacteria bacterium]
MDTAAYKDGVTLGGHWILALIMIVVGMWIFFKYLAPKDWKEWRNVGLLQAFVIALYAEMYGFPLTIYLLTSFLKLNIPWLHSKGHLWATLLGLGETGAMIEMFLGLGIVFAGITLVFRGWHLIYEAQGKDKLVTDGVYSSMRHPQYTGIFIALFGQLIHWPTLLTFVFFPIIVLAYYHLARKEEKVMEEKFGEEYEIYRRRVPMFIPRIRGVPLLPSEE